MLPMISCLFEKNGQFDLGPTGSETLEEVYSNTSANIIYMVYRPVKIEGFFLSCGSEGKRGYVLVVVRGQLHGNFGP